MSRFEETLQRDLRRIADRATPSPDAWDRIQRRVADQDPPQETEIIMLVDTIHPPMRRWPLAAAAAAAVLALLLGATALLTRDADKQTPAVDTDTVDDERGAITPLFGDLPGPGARLAGGYAVDSLGVPMSFVVPESTSKPWILRVDDGIAVTMGTDDGFLAMSRVGSFYGAAEARDLEMTGLGSLGADDIDGWIAANDVIVSERSEVTIGGRTAVYRQVTASAGSGDGSERCPPDLPPPCLGISTASADLQATYDGPSALLWGTVPHSLWLVELEAFEPLLIWAHSDTVGATEWLATVAPLIESIEIGEPAAATANGTARLPIRVSAAAGLRAVNADGPPNADASVPVSTTGTLNGDATGDVTGAGVRFTVPPDDLAGNGSYSFAGSIDGIGSGTLEWSEEWTSIDGVHRSSATITGGTGDFAGATGTVTFSLRTTNFIDQTSEEVIGTTFFDIVLPTDG